MLDGDDEGLLDGVDEDEDEDDEIIKELEGIDELGMLDEEDEEELEEGSSQHPHVGSGVKKDIDHLGARSIIDSTVSIILQSNI